jgi:hypothetical protein
MCHFRLLHRRPCRQSRLFLETEPRYVMRRRHRLHKLLNLQKWMKQRHFRHRQQQLMMLPCR